MKLSKLLPGLCLGTLGLAAASSVAVLTATGPCYAHGSDGSPQMAAAPAASAAVASRAGDVAGPISRLYARLTQVESSHGSFAQRTGMLTPIIDQAFNLQTVLQNSLGLRYHTLPDAQKQQLLDQFRQFTVARYVSNFAPGGSDTFKVDPNPTPSPVPGDQIVHTQILSGGGSTVVNYVMRHSGSGAAGAGWQLVDVLLDGNISQVAVQRADFGSSFSSGDAAPLIDSLKKKTRAFSES